MIEIKICGITNEEDALFAAESGVDALGFIFYRKSPRYIAPEQAKEIIAKIPQGIATVGVFVNESVEVVKEIIASCHLTLVQFHGDESRGYCRQFPPASIIKAFSPRREDDLDRINGYPAGAVLVDTYEPGRYGGTGRTSNWTLAAAIATMHPLILSGGLREDNICDAINAVSPRAVDINSGVEASPGKKDRRKVREIIKIVRGMDHDFHKSDQTRLLFRDNIKDVIQNVTRR